MMTQEENFARRAAFSWRSHQAGDTPSPTDNPGAPGVAQSADSFPDFGGNAGHSPAMGRCIARHRRLLAAVARFSRERAMAGSWTPRAAAAYLSLPAGRILERLARWRLICRKPTDSREAELKILYLMALTIAQRVELRPEAIARAADSLEDFHPQLRDLLRTHRHNDCFDQPTAKTPTP